MHYLHPELLIFITITAVGGMLVKRYGGPWNMDRSYALIFWGSVFLSITSAFDYADTYLFRDFFVENVNIKAYRSALTLFGYAPGVVLVGLGIANWFHLTARLEDEVQRRIEAEARIREISEDYRRVAKLAEAANLSKSDFLRNMSHELRTPLNAIIGFSDILRQELKDETVPDYYREYLEQINKAGLGLLDIINDVLEMARLEGGLIQLHEDDCSLPELIEHAIDLMEPQIEQGGVFFDLQLEDDVWLKADPRMVQQMIFNLVSNAVKFTEEGDSVTIATRVRTDGNIVLAVQDTGCGMSEEEVSEVIKPFAQAENVLTKRHDGAGLGLSLVNRYIELHGGSIEVASEEGKGTTVSLCFPKFRRLSMAA